MNLEPLRGMSSHAIRVLEYHGTAVLAGANSVFDQGFDEILREYPRVPKEYPKRLNCPELTFFQDEQRTN